MNRLAELAELRRLAPVMDTHAEDRREFAVYVIAGTAGVGKTALALHWAHQIGDRFPDGQLYANLRGYDPGLPVSPDQVLEGFLRALDVPPSLMRSDPESQAALYRSWLADRRMLILLDNAATVGQVRPLLPGASHSLVLVTSRSRLSGLVARDGAHRLTVDTFAPAEAVTLLKTVTADYRAGDAERDIEELARLCARLPLALRIAAERAASRPHMPLTELIADLRDESGLWDALAADDEEADAVRSVFAWSYRALPAEAARLFRLLGIHPGPQFSTTAVAVLADITTRHARHLLDVLIGAHLLEQRAPDRFQFHDLLRAYATDQAQHEETPERRQAILIRLLTWYLHTADAAAAVIDSHFRRLPLTAPLNADVVMSFTDHEEAVRWYETERDNLVAATHAAAAADLHQIAWQLPVVLRAIYAFRNPFSDWLDASLIGLSAARRVGARSGEADLLESLGMAYVQSQRTAEGLWLHQQALFVRRELGDEFGEATSLNSIGLAYLRSRQLSEARAYFEQCLTIVRRLGDRRWEGIALGNLANTYVDLGALERARELAGQALTIHRETDNKVSEFACLLTLSSVHRERSELDSALRYMRSAQDVAQQLDNPVREAYALLELGKLQLVNELLEDALLSYHRAAVLHRNIGDASREADAFAGTGEVYRKLGRLDEAADFYRQAVSNYRKHDDRWQLAVALDHLAGTLHQAGGDLQAAQAHWREAMAIFADFPDPKSVDLHDRIRAVLEADEGNGR